MSILDTLRAKLSGPVPVTADLRTAARLERLLESGDWQLKRAQEDVTWQNLSKESSLSTQLEREQKIAWARTAFATDSFAKRGVLLKTDFCFGSGIDGPRGKQKPGEPTDPNVQMLLDHWNDPGNQASMYAAPMQAKRSNQLIVDGDLCLLLFVGKGGEVKVRRIGSTLVKKIITDPDDSTRPLYYACKTQDYRFDAQSGGLVATGAGVEHWTYYRDFRNSEPAEDPLFGQVPADPDVYMMHVPLNSLQDGGFGESDLLTSLAWNHRANELTKDQGIISKVTAALMNTLGTRTKNKSALAELARSVQSTTAEGGPKAPQAGSMNVLSDGTELQVNRASTNAGDAWQNWRMMRMGSAVGQGFPLHYLGDPENASLATARVMDTPTLKMLEAYQTLWRSVYVAIFNFVLLQHGVDPATVKYDIPMPVFQEPDTAEIVAAIMDGEDRGLITHLQAAQRLMELLGFDDIPERLQELMDDQAASDAADSDRAAQDMAALDADEPGQDVSDDTPPA